MGADAHQRGQCSWDRRWTGGWDRGRRLGNEEESAYLLDPHKDEPPASGSEPAAPLTHRSWVGGWGRGGLAGRSSWDLVDAVHRQGIVSMRKNEI